MSRSNNRKIADLAPFDPSTLATVATSGAYSALSGTPTLGTASTQATGAFATAAQGTTANAALPKAGGAVTGNVTFGDNDKVVMGAGSDLQLYHDGSDSYISDQGTGQLLILGSNAVAINNATNTENMIVAMENGAVNLYHDNALKIATTSSGIDVTGTVNADALTGIGSIDATTATAIGAAGVGGSTVYLGETLITSNVSYVQYNFPAGYQRFVFQIIGWEGQIERRDFRCRLTDSSNNLISSGSTYWAGNTTDASSFASNSYIFMGKVAESGDLAPRTNGLVTIESPLATDIGTGIFVNGIYTSNNTSTVMSRRGYRRSVEKNNGIRFFLDFGNIGSASHGYKVWGIK